MNIGGLLKKVAVSLFHNSSSLTDESLACPVDICLNGYIITGGTFFLILD